MYWRILKKDLKHKPVTNIILLLFITLSVMCAAAGVNNVMTVLTAQEDYYDRAGMADCIAFLTNAGDNTVLEDALESSEAVTSFQVDTCLNTWKDNYRTEGAEDSEYLSVIMLTNLSESSMNYFGEDNQILTAPQPGEMYVPKKLVDKGLFRVGETCELTFGETKLTLTVIGTAKDAVLGSESMGMARVFISAQDFATLSADPAAATNRNKVFNIFTEDTSAVLSLIAGTEGVGSNVSITRSQMNLINYLPLVIAGLLVLLSACLIVVFLILLRYTIRFTLSQELREIGIMKAVGLHNKDVEKIYLIKYLFLAILGAVLGFAASIPFGKLLLKSLAETIVIEGQNVWGVNLLCTLMVTGLVMLFCQAAIKRMRRITPLDAVRNNNTEEDGIKKNRFSLGKSKLKLGVFLPLKRILTGLKQYLIMGFACFVCLLLTLVVVDTVNTMDSGSIFSMCGLHSSDAIWVPEEYPEEWLELLGEDFSLVTYNPEKFQLLIQLCEDKIADMGIQAEVFMDISALVNLQRGENSTALQLWFAVNLSADEYDYLSGTAPVGDYEIALTPSVADSLGAEIGDTIWVTFGNTKHEFLVTGLFQSMMNIGQSARVGTDALFRSETAEIAGTLGLQIIFEDGLSTQEKNRQFQTLNEEFSEKFYTATELLYTLIGDISTTLGTVRNILAPLMLAICAFVVVLMETSFIDKEKGEIALMKAIGFRRSYIRHLHLKCAAVTTVIAAVLAELLALPVAQITTGIAFRTMGAVQVDFLVDPLEVYLFWPLTMLAVVLTAVGLTTLTANRITACDAANIE